MVGRIIWAAVILAAVYFVVQGGEYSTLDIWRHRKTKATLLAQIDSLQRQVDSLKAVEEAIRTDPVVQERIAREEFGMVRGAKEILYKFVGPGPADSSARSNE